MTALVEQSAADSAGALSLAQLLRRLEAADARSCDTDGGGCGLEQPLAKRLRAVPQLFTVILAWATGAAAADSIRAVLDLVHPIMRVADVFSEVEVPSPSTALHQLRSMARGPRTPRLSPAPSKQPSGKRVLEAVKHAPCLATPFDLCAPTSADSNRPIPRASSPPRVPCAPPQMAFYGEHYAAFTFRKETSSCAASPACPLLYVTCPQGPTDCCLVVRAA